MRRDENKKEMRCKRKKMRLKREGIEESTGQGVKREQDGNETGVQGGARVAACGQLVSIGNWTTSCRWTGLARICKHLSSFVVAVLQPCSPFTSLVGRQAKAPLRIHDEH